MGVASIGFASTVSGQRQAAWVSGYNRPGADTSVFRALSEVLPSEKASIGVIEAEADIVTGVVEYFTQNEVVGYRGPHVSKDVERVDHTLHFVDFDRRKVSLIHENEYFGPAVFEPIIEFDFDEYKARYGN